MTLRRVPAWCWVLLLFLGLTVVLTWPLPSVWTSHLPGQAHKDGLEDAYQNVWNLWWMRTALAQPTNPLITDRLFYPERPNLYYHTLSPVNALLATPITALWGPIAGFNALVAASFVLAALGAWFLAYDRTGSAPAALVAGFIYAWCPFHVAAVVDDGQLQIFSLQWIPFYVLWALRVADRQDRRSVLWAGLLLGMIAWTDWYATVCVLIWTGGFVIRRIIHLPTWSARRRLLGRMVGVGVVGGIAAAPLVVPMLIEAARASYMTRYPASDVTRLSADVVAYLLPARLHPWWGGTAWSWSLPPGLNRRFYLGVLPLLLAAMGLWRTRAARPWAWMALGFGVLSLGPTLTVAGHATGLPLPYRLVMALPFVRLARQPDRFAVLVMLALAVSAAYGVRTLIAQRRAWVWRSGFILVLAVLVVEYLPTPMSVRQPTVPPFLATLPTTDDRALLEVPFHDDLPYRDAERMFFQTVHGRPISGGYHSRLYPQPQYGLPVLRDLAAGTLESDIVRETSGWRAALSTLHYGYIIGYKQQPNGPRNLTTAEATAFKALVEQGLEVTRPDAEDGWLIAYAVPAAPPVPVVQIRAGWDRVETDARGPYRWFAQTADLGLIVPQAGHYRVQWDGQAAGMARTLRVHWGSQTLTIAVTPESRRYAMVVDLPAGTTVIDFTALEAPTTGAALFMNGDERPLSMRMAAIDLTRVDP